MKIQLKSIVSTVIFGFVLLLESPCVFALIPAETAKLLASDGAAREHFGWSIGLDGDTIVIGALGGDDADKNSGSAYVFTRSGGVWTQQAKLNATDAAIRINTV